GSCAMYRSGCNASCPTAHEYPRLKPELIATAWQGRADAFTGADAIPLIANSHWTAAFARQRFGQSASIDVVHLGLDHHMFAPIDRSVARRLLQLPPNKPIIMMGAVNVQDPRKGGSLFLELHNWLSTRDDLALVLFGGRSHRLASLKSFGLV